MPLFITSLVVNIHAKYLILIHRCQNRRRQLGSRNRKWVVVGGVWGVVGGKMRRREVRKVGGGRGGRGRKRRMEGRRSVFGEEFFDGGLGAEFFAFGTHPMRNYATCEERKGEERKR
jgi:hypothetical protein